MNKNAYSTIDLNARRSAQIGIRLNIFSDKQFIQPRICAGTSQILLVTERNLKFCSRPQRKTFRNGRKND